MTENTTLHVHNCLRRLQHGDVSAKNDLLQSSARRLSQLTEQMLAKYQGVRRWEAADDVYQNAMLRLCRTLDVLTPASPLDYFRLASVQIRRELIDLSRHYFGPLGVGANHGSHVGLGSQENVVQRAVGATDDPAEAAQWSEFHEHVANLPDTERDVFDLVWYQGLPQEEAAEVLGVSLRTVKSRWRSARCLLYERLGGNLPFE